MKKTLFPVLAAALVMTACGTKTTEQTAQTAQTETTARVGASDIAYVQVEAVLAQCDLFLTEGKALQEKTEKAQKSWAQREQNLQAEVAQLQEKFQKGLITSRDAQAQQESLQKRAASYQNNAQKEAQSLDEENYVFTNRAQDLLNRSRSTPTGSTSSSSTPRRSSTPIRRSTSRPPCCRRSMSCTLPTKRPRRSKTAGQKAKKRFPRQRGSRFFHTFAGKLTTD